MSQLVVRGFQSWISASVDLGFIMARPEDNGFMSERADGSWLGMVEAALARHGAGAFATIERVSSEYARTDRAQRNTFASQHAGELLPLELGLERPNQWQEGVFVVTPEACRISPRGGVTAKLHVRIPSDGWIPVDRIVADYNRVLARVPRISLDVFVALCECWQRCGLSPHAASIDEDGLKQHLAVYEVIDVRCGREDGSRVTDIGSFKNLYRRRDPITKQLAALCSMSLSAIASLRHANLADFISDDIGDRSDELWVVNRFRMVRDHPDRDKPYVEAFFADCRTLADIMVADHATLSYLRDWVRHARRGIIGSIVGDAPGDDIPGSLAGLGAVACAGELLCEPLLLHRDVRHGFFVALTKHMTNRLGIDEEREASAAELAGFARTIEASTAARVGILSTSLQKAQVDLAASARRLSIAATVLGVLGLGAAVVGVVCVIVFGTRSVSVTVVPPSTQRPTSTSKDAPRAGEIKGGSRVRLPDTRPTQRSSHTASNAH
jgi:hypothetical protein